MLRLLEGLAAVGGLAAASYALYAAFAWCRYGRGNQSHGEDTDAVLDRFMPVWEVGECHCLRVAAPAEIALSAACDLDLRRSVVVRGIFKLRELALGARPPDADLPRALMAQMKALGWGVLAEIPGREMVFGAVTRPWEANVIFRPLAPDEFVKFREPGYVKIVWTLRADPLSAGESLCRTETRVAATDATARARFRRYWAFVSPGIVVIRRISLGLVKAEAERRALLSA